MQRCCGTISYYRTFNYFYFRLQRNVDLILTCKLNRIILQWNVLCWLAKTYNTQFITNVYSFRVTKSLCQFIHFPIRAIWSFKFRSCVFHCSCEHVTCLPEALPRHSQQQLGMHVCNCRWCNERHDDDILYTAAVLCTCRLLLHQAYILSAQWLQLTYIYILHA